MRTAKEIAEALEQTNDWAELEQIVRDAVAYLRTLPDPPVLPRSASSPQGWQDIATAPRPSGRRKVIDVWCYTDDHEAAKFYFGASMCGVKDRTMWQGRVCDVYWRDGAWRPVGGIQHHSLTVTPTHWIDLPAPPSVAVDGAGWQPISEAQGGASVLDQPASRTYPRPPALAVDGGEK
jgi:hypothetical protein